MRKKIITVFSGIVLAMVLMVACGGGGGSSGGNAAKNIAGTWEGTIMGATATMTFNADGTGTSQAFGMEEDFAYETEVITFQNPETKRDIRTTKFTYGIKDNDGNWMDTRGSFFYDKGDELSLPGGMVYTRVR